MTRTRLSLPHLCALLLGVALASCGGSDSGTTTPKDDPVASVTVSPSGPTVDIDATTTLTATVTTEGGADVTASSSIVWSADAPAIATVEGSGATAVVHGVSKGSGGIRAEVGSKGGRVTVLVVDPRLPEAPSSVVAVPVARSEIVVGWSDNAGNETGFRIEREEVSSSGSGAAATFQLINQVGANATSFRNSGVDPEATYRYLVRACNENGCSPEAGAANEIDAVSEPVSVLGGAPRITTTDLPDGAYDVAYSKRLDVVGGDGEYDWSLVSGELPAGLELDLSTGTISGVPLALGTAGFTVEVTSEGTTDQQELSLTVVASPLVVNTVFLAGGYVGVAYADEVTAGGGDGSLEFSVLGDLPPGLELDPASGALTGTPSESGVSYFTIEARSGDDRDTQTFAMAISTRPPEEFNMWVANASDGDDIPSDKVIEAIEAAVARWEQHIVGDLQPITFGPNEMSTLDCGRDGVRLNGQFVDDMVILLELDDIDGAGGVLGSAGPCWVRVFESPPGVNTVFGRLTLDTSDLANLSDHQRMMLAFHEIGHIVGLGTLWRAGTQLDRPELEDLVRGVGGTDPRYLGEGGNGEFTGALGGGSADADEIPIEADGGSGTAYSHWDEGEFDTEVMTGYLEGSGFTQQISAMTIAAVGDLAYTVTTDGADPYTIPGCAPACSAAPPAGVAPFGGAVLDLTDDILREPIGARLPDGRVVYFEPIGRR